MFLSKITDPLHSSSYQPLYVNSKYPSESFVDDSTTIFYRFPNIAPLYPRKLRRWIVRFLDGSSHDQYCIGLWPLSTYEIYNYIFWEVTINAECTCVFRVSCVSQTWLHLHLLSLVRCNLFFHKIIFHYHTLENIPLYPYTSASTAS